MVHGFTTRSHAAGMAGMMLGLMVYGWNTQSAQGCMCIMAGTLGPTSSTWS